MSQSAFSSLALSKALLQNIESLGYQSMTDIQQQSLPPILAGKDVIAQGKTGSGKTAAFGLGLLEKLNVKRFRIQSLVLCPTRELADQVAKELRKLARTIHNIKILTLCGGVPFGPQVGSLEHGAHIIVGTPGRIEDHLGRGTLRLDDLNLLVLDEADRMLEMGFQDAIDRIIASAPTERQTLLFSATFPKQIEAVAKRILIEPVTVKVESTHEDSTIHQHFYQVDHSEAERTDAVRLLLMQFKPQATVIFCNTKVETQNLADNLAREGFSAVALHGDLEQRDRDQTLVRFSNKSAQILVATDVAARGLDIDFLEMVINYNVAHDSEIHVHRIGRTGRAGATGIACTLFTQKEQYKIGQLEDTFDKTITAEILPSTEVLNQPIPAALMTTIQIDGGKKQKVRAGDVLGALTGNQGIEGKQVGKIQIFEHWTYVAVEPKALKTALRKLGDGKIKGRNFRVRHLKNGPQSIYPNI